MPDSLMLFGGGSLLGAVAEQTTCTPVWLLACSFANNEVSTKKEIFPSNKLDLCRLKDLKIIIDWHSLAGHENSDR